MGDKTYTIKHCDICHSKIDYDWHFEDSDPKRYKDGAYTNLIMANYQAFYVDGEKIEACERCSNVIRFAVDNLGVEFDDTELWLRAGFERVNNEWKHKDRDKEGAIWL